jgi:hypothetical protein
MVKDLEYVLRSRVIYQGQSTYQHKNPEVIVGRQMNPVEPLKVCSSII